MYDDVRPHRLLGEMAYCLRRLLEDDRGDPSREFLRESARAALVQYADYVAPMPVRPCPAPAPEPDDTPPRPGTPEAERRARNAMRHPAEWGKPE
jgi:hypothetical protein